MWFDDGGDAPLGRTRRAFYYYPFGDDEVKERSVRMLKIAPDSEGKPLSGDVDELLAEREAIEEYLNNRLSSIRTTHKRASSSRVVRSRRNKRPLSSIFSTSGTTPQVNFTNPSTKSKR